MIEYKLSLASSGAVKAPGYEDMLRFGVAEAVIPEPEGGAQNDLDKISENIKEYLVKTIAEKSQKDIDVLQKERYTKFRKIGVFQETPENS